MWENEDLERRDLPQIIGIVTRLPKAGLDGQKLLNMTICS
jgi:hypothetical protein